MRNGGYAAAFVLGASLAASAVSAAGGPSKVKAVPAGLKSLSLAAPGPLARLPELRAQPLQALERLRASQVPADAALYAVLAHPAAISRDAELAAAIGPENVQALAAAAQELERLAAQDDAVKRLLSSGGDSAGALAEFKRQFDGARRVWVVDADGVVSVPPGFSEPKPRASGLKPAARKALPPASRPKAEPRVVVGADSDVARALAHSGRRPLDPADLPAEARPRFEKLVGDSAALLDSMLELEDGAGKIHVVLLDDMRPTAVTTRLGNGEKVIGLNIGLFDVVENDAELAFVLAQQLEHAKGQLAAEAAELKAKKQIEGDFLERTASNEADVRAVERLVDKGLSPHAAVDYLNRLRAKVGDVLEPRTSSLLTTRVGAVGGAITLLVRSRGGNEEHRLDSLPRPRRVVEGAAESLRSPAFRERLEARVEALLSAEGAGEKVYEEVKEGAFFGAGLTPDDNAFSEDFKRIWREVLNLQLEPLAPRRAIDMQIRLVQNLDRAYARAREKVLGPEFHAESAYQVRGLLAAEKRTYSLSAPNLFGAAHELFEVEQELSDVEERAIKPGADGHEAWQRELQLVRSRLADARGRFELAKYPYEPDAELDAKLRQVHEKDDSRLEDWSRDYLWGGVPRWGQRLPDSLGLRLREVQGLFTGEDERVKAVKKIIKEPKPDPSHNLYYFLANGVNPAERDDHTVEEYRELFDAFLAIVRREFGPEAGEQPRTVNLRYLTEDRINGKLGSFFYRYHALEPADADARLREVFDVLLERDWKPEQLGLIKAYLNGFGRVASPASKEAITAKLLLKSAAGMVDEVRSAKTVDEVLGLARKIREAVRDGRSYRSDDGIRLPAEARRELLEALTERLAAASESGLGAARAETLIKVLVPSLDDSPMAQADYDRLGAAFAAIAADPALAGELAGKVSYDELGHALVDRPYPEREDDPDDETSEAYEARKKREEAKYKAYHDEVTAGIPGFWSLVKETHGFLRFGAKDERSHRVFMNTRQVVEELLGKAGDERPFDLELARKLYHGGDGTDAWKPMLGFMDKSFRARLKKGPDVAEATFRFWKAVDDAGLAPTYYDMDGIGQVIKGWNPGVAKTKIDGREYEHLTPGGVTFFLQYLEGTARFAEHAVRNGRKAVYSPRNTTKEDPRREEIDHRVNFEHVTATLSNPELRRPYGARQRAELYHRLLDAGQAPYPSAEHDKIFEELWASRERDPAVRALMSDPRLVDRLFYHSNQMKLAQWQLSKLPGYESFLSDYKARRARLPPRSGIRPVVERAHELVKRQFPGLSPARNEILAEVEKKLLTNEPETKLLASSRINETNWTKSGFMSLIDAPAVVNKGLRDNYERLRTLRYLIGLDPEAPELLDRKSFMELDTKKLRAFQRSYAENGTAFRTMTLLPLLDEKQGLLSDPEHEAEVLKIVIGSHYDDPELRILAETYLQVLPASEKKALLAGILSGYDPNSRSTGSLKRLLTAGGPLGAKGAQGLLTSGLVDAKTRAEFLEFFDDFMKPGREQVFKHLQEIFGEHLVHMEGLGEIPGSGSLNYVAKVALRNPDTGQIETVVVRVQKDDVPSLIRNENKVWLDVYARLKDHPNARVRRLARLIEEVREQSFSTLGEKGTELDLAQEAARHDEAEKAYGDPTPDGTGFTVEAVKPNRAWQDRIDEKWRKRVAVYEAIDAVRLEDVSPRLRKSLARRIIRAEHKARASGTFDPDGHLRNWLIDLKGKRLVRIDTAQLVGPEQIKPQDIVLFNRLLKELMGVKAIAQGGLANLMSRYFGGIFAQDARPKDLEKVIGRAVADPRLPPATAPIERLLFVQDFLETHYQGYRKKGLSFPLTRAIKLQLAAEMRTGMFRPWAGGVAYLGDLADSIGAGRAELAGSQLRSVVESGAKELGRRVRSLFKPKSR